MLLTVIGTLGMKHGSSFFDCCQCVPALCVFEGRQYSLGETWMDACMQCTLHKQPVVHRPVDFPAWCEVRVESLICKVSLVQTADPRLPCYPGEDIRDPATICSINLPVKPLLTIVKYQ
uniref:Uncharacterized protein n=1 Tax=Cyclopterus lumpus TaxID=8103 RepID=A0A8C2X158_CYCLU